MRAKGCFGILIAAEIVDFLSAQNSPSGFELRTVCRASGRSSKYDEKQVGRDYDDGRSSIFSPKESGIVKLAVKVPSTISDADLSSRGITLEALKKSRHFFRVEISGPFYDKTRCAIEWLQAAEEEDIRGIVQQRCAYRPARRQDQFSTERDDLCRNLCNEQRHRIPP
jgi:hypothetical protein